MEIHLWLKHNGLYTDHFWYSLKFIHLNVQNSCKWCLLFVTTNIFLNLKIFNRQHFAESFASQILIIGPLRTKSMKRRKYPPLSQSFKWYICTNKRNMLYSWKTATILKFSVKNVIWTLTCQFKKGWKRSNWNVEADWDQSESVQEIWYSSTNKIKKRWLHCKKSIEFAESTLLSVQLCKN